MRTGTCWLWREPWAQAEHEGQAVRGKGEALCVGVAPLAVTLARSYARTAGGTLESTLLCATLYFQPPGGGGRVRSLVLLNAHVSLTLRRRWSA